MMSLLLLAIGLLFAPQQASQPPAAGGLDTVGIDRALGRRGTLQPDGVVYKVAAPRSDLEATVNGIPIRTGLTLGSWIAFRRHGAEAAVHGDLVVTERELNPVISALQDGGLEITAVHNHIVGQTPPVMYVHYFGHGPEIRLAQTMASVLSRTATPPPSTSPPDTAPFEGAEALQAALGRKGSIANGVLSISVPRPEKIQMMGVELPPSMGMATAFNFQAAGGGRVLGTGDFVMVGDEVNKVARALRQHDIEITALHNHMIGGSPDLYFMHFWAVGLPDRVAAGLKAALALMKG